VTITGSEAALREAAWRLEDVILSLGGSGDSDPRGSTDVRLHKLAR
jgi:hypothetical protein